jgi:hypothetical protein
VDDSLPNQSMENLSLDGNEIQNGCRQDGDGKSMESEENGKYNVFILYSFFFSITQYFIFYSFYFLFFIFQSN